MEKSKKKIIVLVAILVAVILIGISIPLSFAWFTDSAESGSDVTINFGTVSVSADISKPQGKQVVLTPNELLYGNGGATRELTIKNTGTVSCYARFSVVVKIDGAQTNKITVSASTSNVAKQSDGKYLLVTSSNPTQLAPNSNSTISLKFDVTSDFGNQYKGKSVTVDVAVEATQVANNDESYGEINW